MLLQLFHVSEQSWARLRGKVNSWVARRTVRVKEDQVGSSKTSLITKHYWIRWSLLGWEQHSKGPARGEAGGCAPKQARPSRLGCLGWTGRCGLALKWVGPGTGWTMGAGRGGMGDPWQDARRPRVMRSV